MGWRGGEPPSHPITVAIATHQGADERGEWSFPNADTRR
jgi:hypothetical protein